MATLAKLFVELGLEPKGFNKGLDSAESKLKKTSANFRKIGLGMTAAFTLPLIAGTKELLDIGKEWDNVMDTLQTETGKTGADLEALGQSVKTVFGSIPADMQDVADAIALVSQKTGLTGPPLELISKQLLELSRITETDLAGNISAVTELFDQWQISTEKQSSTLDMLFKASQLTGVPVAELANQLDKFGPILRSFGFDLESSTALLANLGQAGVDPANIITGLRTAFAGFSDAGVTDTRKELEKVFELIRNSPSDTEAAGIGLDTFGNRAGIQMANLIRNGTLSYQELLTLMEGSESTILHTAEDTNDLSETWMIFKNRLKIAVIPIATSLFNFLNKKAIPVLTKIAEKVEVFATWFARLSPWLKIAIVAFVALLAVIGPILIVFSFLITAITGIIAAFSAGGIFAAGGALALFGPILLVIALVVAAVILLAIAWKKNWFDIQGKTKTAIDFISKWLGKLREFVQPAIDTIILLGQYFHDVMTNKIQPGNLAKLPGWLQPIAFVLGRIIKTLRVFIKVWQDKGFLAALQTIPKQIRAFGRAFAGLFAAIGLKRFAEEVKRTFNDLARLFGHTVELFDDIIHGRWSQVWGDLGRIALDLFWLLVDRLRMGLALLLDLFELIPWTRIGIALGNGFISAITYLVTVGVPWAITKGIELLGALLGGMQTFWDETLIPWIQEIPGKLFSFLASDNTFNLMFSVGTFLIGALWSGFGSLMVWIFNQIFNFVYTIATGIQSLYNLFYSTGQFLIGGLWSGIASLFGWIRDQFLGWLGSLVDAANSVLGNHSPSKVFEKVGINTMAGFIEGVRSMQGKAQNTVAGALSFTGTGTTGTPQLAAMPAVAGAGGGGRGAATFNITNHINGTADAQETARLVVRETIKAIRRREAGLP